MHMAGRVNFKTRCQVQVMNHIGCNDVKCQGLLTQSGEVNLWISGTGSGGNWRETLTGGKRSVLKLGWSDDGNTL